MKELKLIDGGENEHFSKVEGVLAEKKKYNTASY